MAKFGAIYIAHNPHDGADTFKVGKTERRVEERMADLTSETSNLGRYDVLGWVVVDDIDAAEAACHNRLVRARVQQNREFFKLAAVEVIRVVREACAPWIVQDRLPASISVPSAAPSNIDGLLADVMASAAQGAADVLRKSSENLKAAKEDAVRLLGRLAELKQKESALNGTKAILDLDAVDSIKLESPTLPRPIATIRLHGSLKNPPARIRQYARNSYGGVYPSTVEDDDGRWSHAQVVVLLDARTAPGINQRVVHGHIISARIERIGLRSDGYYDGRDARTDYENHLIGTATFPSRDEAVVALIRWTAANSVVKPELSRTMEVDHTGHFRRRPHFTNDFNLVPDNSQLEPWYKPEIPHWQKPKRRR